MLHQIWVVLRTFFVIIGMFTVAVAGVKLSRGELEFAPIFGSRPVPDPVAAVPMPGLVDESRLDTVKVTVTDNRYLEEIPTRGDALRPGMGKIFLICDVSISYEGNQEVSVNDGQFRIVSQEGLVYKSMNMGYEYRHTSYTMPRDFQPLRATMVRGGRASGTIVFQVNPGTTIKEIRFDA